MQVSQSKCKGKHLVSVIGGGNGVLLHCQNVKNDPKTVETDLFQGIMKRRLTLVSKFFKANASPYRKECSICND